MIVNWLIELLPNVFIFFLPVDEKYSVLHNSVSAV